MAEKDSLPRYSQETLDAQITLWVPSKYKEKYSALADRNGNYRIKMAEKLREKMLAAIDEVWAQVKDQQSA